MSQPVGLDGQMGGILGLKDKNFH